MNNHHNRLTKAYRGLSADHSAALAFHYISEGNELEFNRLADAVPRKDYTCPDLAYQTRLDGLTRFAAFWAIEYWRLRSRKAELLGASIALHHKGNHETADEFLEAHEQTEASLLALDTALMMVCHENGLNPSDVRRIAGTEQFKARREATVPDNIGVKETKEALTRFFTT